MKIIAAIIVIAIIFYLLSTIWPLILLLIFAFALWKIYEYYYFQSESFTTIKQRINSYIDDCNELNDHIEELKSTSLISNKIDYGNASYHDSSNWNYQRKNLKNQQYTSHIHQCSRTVCDNARKKPFEYICKYFGIKADEQTLSSFEAVLNNFEAAEEGKNHLLAEKEEILKSIESDIPALIKKFSKNKLEKNLGFQQIDMSTAYFPKYVFEYVSSGGNASTQCDIVMDLDNLNRFVLFLSEKIKFNNSVAGQRSLMTSKLRQQIKERDHFTCQKCGVSIEQEPHLLLEIDHIVPISKVGLTKEDNLQTLCWRCNRSKGAKI